MNRWINLLTTAALACVGGIAHARDVGPDEALRLRDAGAISAFEHLNQVALAQHSGARIDETELEEEYGRYLYQVELLDPQGVRWELELDASTGEILKNHRDD